MEPILYAAAAVLAITALVNWIARSIDVPSPIVLVVAGVILALAPGLPRIALPPNLVLLVFLPPLIYYAAFGMSWQAFRDNLSEISMLAVGCVVFTTIVVAAAAHWLIGLPWAIAFVLGAIVSPPDVVAPLAIARRLGVPSRITAILEGEGLVNDATALVLFKFALTAVLTGVFSLADATMTFAAIVVSEALWGFIVGWLMLRLRYWANEPRIEVTLSLLTPFLAFWIPHAAGGSGVLATVIAGLYVGNKGVELIRSKTRLQAIFFWDFLTYLIEGAIFLLTGLQARVVLEGLGSISLGELFLYAVAISFVAIAVRFVWVFPATYVQRWLSPTLRAKDPLTPWQHPFIISFTGIRGVVSLAAALSIPVVIGGDQPFPHRHLILFLTFSVIVVTLVVQGPVLPWLVRKLGLTDSGSKEQLLQQQQEADARLEAARAALVRLPELSEEIKLPAEQIRQVRELLGDRVSQLEHRRDLCGQGSEVAARVDRLELALIQTEREYVNGLLRSARITDEIRRRIERELDLRE
ncbi:MAG TPA: Na+/H+ antiporter, partial [Burkholderiaceae bacterium]|nr:Na+/H+ antiporter [Burkholderiaceae bacterium]